MPVSHHFALFQDVTRGVPVCFQHLISLSDDDLAPIEPINAGGDGVAVKNAGSVHNLPQNSGGGVR